MAGIGDDRGDRKAKARRNLKSTIDGLSASDQGGPRKGSKKPAPKFENFKAYQDLRTTSRVAKTFGIDNPYFKESQSRDGSSIEIGGRSYVNFSSYNYLGLNDDPRVRQAAVDAIGKYGTSSVASRPAGAELSMHRELEGAIAEFYGVEDCIVFVSGYTTNESVISTLFKEGDLVLYDTLAHRSVIEGARHGGAACRQFSHNDWRALEFILERERDNFDNVLIVIEGNYSMDGDVPDLAAFVRVKENHAAFLMVDEAHALGVLGPTGRGIAEYCDVGCDKIDIWMGTLSKSLASTGGFIAGSRVLIELLKITVPGFFYSVALSPPLAAAAKKSLEILQAEPEHVARLQENGKRFLECARDQGLDTGDSVGCGIVPVIIGTSLRAVAVSMKLFEKGFYLIPVIYPGVEEQRARLRFFVTAQHTDSEIDEAVEVTSNAIREVEASPVMDAANALLRRRMS